jgi:hypothetical protein
VTNLAATNWTSVSEETSLINGLLTLTNVSTDAARFYRLAPAGPPVPVIYVRGGIWQRNYLLTFHDTLPLANVNADGENGFDPCGYETIDGNLSVICDIPTDPDIGSGILSGEVKSTFDASASVDPRSFSNSSLSYHWDFFESVEYGGQQYMPPDITNYDSSVMTIPVQGIPQQPLSGDFQSPFWLVRLTQHQPYDPNAVPSEQTVAWFRFNYIW